VPGVEDLQQFLLKVGEEAHVDIIFGGTSQVPSGDFQGGSPRFRHN
jgi:hypothetical protein